MDLYQEYQSSKSYFQQGQYQRSLLSCKKILETDISFETKVILKANLFIAELITSKKSLNIEQAKNFLSLFKGIKDKELQENVAGIFLKNLCLYLISQNKFDSAKKLIDNHETYNNEEMAEINGSIYLSQNIEPNFETPFLSVWHGYLTNNYNLILETIGQLTDETANHFLLGFAHFGLKHYNEALRHFELSISRKFRISECLNFSGICCYFLKRIKDSVNYFEQSIKRSSNVMSSSLFNLAEVCGVLGRTAEQLSLLQFYTRMQFLSHPGSLSTMYLLARTTLENRNYQDAASRYADILIELTDKGIDPPSSTFMAEYSYALNMIGNFDLALDTLSLNNANTDFEKAVVAHSLFLSQNYRECEKIVNQLELTGENWCNKAILSFLAGDDRAAFQQINNARKNSPNNEQIVRNAILINYSRPQTIKAGCVIWLTFCGYQKDHRPEFYQDLIDQMRLSGNQDELTICALENWKRFVLNKPI